MKNIPKVNRAMQHVLRVVIFSCFFLALSNVSEATHFRYGSIAWRKVSGNTYEITVSQAWRKTYFTNVVGGGTVNTGILELGDGSSTNVLLEVTTINPTDDWFYGVFVYTKTYAATPTIKDYKVTFTGCCRISTLKNAADDGYLSSTTINVGTTNNSPVATGSPIKNVQTNVVNTFGLGIYEPDGDALTYRFATRAEMGGSIYTVPAGVTINSLTGAVTFSGVGKSVGSQYALGIIVNDGKTSIMVDFIVNIVAQSAPPKFDYAVTPVNGKVYQIAPGQLVSFGIKAFDTDPGSLVTLNGVGLPIGSTMAPSFPSNPVLSSFIWTPTATQFGTFVINFTASDEFGVQTPTSVVIVVSLKPVFNVPPTPANEIELATVAGTPIQFPVQASDPDPLDVVRLTNVVNKPATATLTPMPSIAANPTTANFSWNPAVSDWGEREIEFEATDSYGDKAYHKIGLIVNTPPVFTSTPPVSSILVNQHYVYNITGLDPDLPYGDLLELIGIGVPSWLTFVDNGDGTGSLTGTPTIADAGTYTISLYLEDIYHHSVSNGVPRQLVTITVVPCTIALDSTIVKHVSCNGLSNGTAEVIFTGGFGPFTYHWSNGSTDAKLVAGPGKYIVTITDAYSCVISDTVKITEPTARIITSSTSNYNDFGVSCFGGTNGSAAITATGGTLPYTINWSEGSTGAAVTGLSAGHYTAYVRDANGCADTVSVIISQPAKVTATISSVTNVSCFGGANGSATIAVTGGKPSYSVLWSTGAVGVTASGLSVGTYTAHIIDANGCSDTIAVSISQSPKIVTSILQTRNVFCFGGTNGYATIAVTGGTPAYSINWSNGDVGITASGLSIGTYTAHITDAKGCSDTIAVSISQPAKIAVSVSGVSNVSCFGGANGSATIAVTGGTPGYTTLWSTGTVGVTATGLSVGNYTAYVRDQHDCTDTISITISESTKVVASVSGVTNVSCFGGANGSATIAVTGGTPAYTTLWSTGAIGVAATGLSAGNYTAYVRDANGCSDTIGVSISEPTKIMTSVSAVTSVSCFGGANGSATIGVTGGTPAYATLWSTGTVGITATGLSVGTYKAYVTDTNGCKDSISVSISQPEKVVASISSVTHVSCFGGSNGSATATATGGIAPYTYLWSNGNTTKNATGLSAISYSVVITDLNNCSNTTSVVLTQPTKVVASITSVTNVSCFGSMDGSATALATGGVAPYTYLWSNGNTVKIATGLSAVSYSVVITDLNNCSNTASVVLTQPTKVVASITSPTVIGSYNTSCSLDGDGAATITGTGGVLPYTASWNTGSTATSIVGLLAGTYTATLTDKNGCAVTSSITLSKPENCNCVTTPIVPTVSCASCTKILDGQSSSSKCTTGICWCYQCIGAKRC